MESFSAGVLITDGTLVLAGYNPKTSLISGIGGKMEYDEEPSVTAVREMIEELLGFSPSPLLLRLLDDLFYNFKCVRNGSYTFFVLSFPEVEQILKLVQLCNVPSPFYSSFPNTIQDLIQKRIVLPKDSLVIQEITYLYLLPLTINLEIDSLFKQDLKLISKE